MILYPCNIFNYWYITRRRGVDNSVDCIFGPFLLVDCSVHKRGNVIVYCRLYLWISSFSRWDRRFKE